MITPLPAALDWYQMKKESLDLIHRLAIEFTIRPHREPEDIELLTEARFFIERAESIDLKYPTNANGIVIKEQK